MARRVKDPAAERASAGSAESAGAADAETVPADEDGRSTRWDSHRESRREDLVVAAVAAIDLHGPGASIAEIAAVAGVSRPVLYRYFTGKDDLYRAVGAWGADEALTRLLPELLTDAPIRERAARAVAAYLSLVEEHPQVFLLLVEHRQDGDDPFADGKEKIAAALSRTLGDALRGFGIDAAGAEPWAHGLVGLGLSTGEWWLRRRTMSRAAVARYLTEFVWHAFHGIAAEYGVELDAQGQLRLVESPDPAPGKAPAPTPDRPRPRPRPRRRSS